MVALLNEEIKLSKYLAITQSRRLKSTTVTQNVDLFLSRNNLEQIIEFLLNVFTEFTGFSDKIICHYSEKKNSNLPTLVFETRILPQHQQDTGERQDV